MGSSLSEQEKNRIFKRVYGETCAVIGTLCRQFMQALRELDVHRGRTAFRYKYEALIIRVLQSPESTGIVVYGKADSEAILQHIFDGLSMNDVGARAWANTLVWSYNKDNGDLDNVRRHILNTFGIIAHDTLSIYEKLQEIEKETRATYKGTDRDAEDGVEQVIELLEQFPDIAATVYEQAGLTGLKWFPPQAEPAPQAGSDARIFVDAVEDELDSRWWWETATLVGLVVVSVVVSVVTLGTMTPLAAALVGVGITGAVGTTRIISAQTTEERGRAAVAAGFMSEHTFKRLQDDVTGAWRSTIVDLCTAGLLSRIGGSSMRALVFRAVVLEGAGGGLATAVQPNVWHSPNRVALILRGTVVSAASGVGGEALSGVLRARAAIQLSWTRPKIPTGGLKPGSTLRVTAAEGGSSVDAKILKVNSDQLVLEIEGKQVVMRVQEVAEVTSSRPVTDETAGASTPARPTTPRG